MAESNIITRAISVNEEAIAIISEHMRRYADYKSPVEAHGLSDTAYLLPRLTTVGIVYDNYSTEEAAKVLAHLISVTRKWARKSKVSNEDALQVQLRRAKIDSVDGAVPEIIFQFYDKGDLVAKLLIDHGGLMVTKPLR